MSQKRKSHILERLMFGPNSKIYFFLACTFIGICSVSYERRKFIKQGGVPRSAQMTCPSQTLKDLEYHGPRSTNPADNMSKKIHSFQDSRIGEWESYSDEERES